MLSADIAGPGNGSRLQGLDVLRAVLVLLVIVHHAAITYGAIGGWFHIEVSDHDTPQSHLLTLFCATNQAFFMGLLFLIAGYLTPGSIRRKGIARHLQDRWMRLAPPLLLFAFILGPMTASLAGMAGGAGFWAGLADIWERHLAIVGPLWFAEALLLFDGVAVAWLAFGLPLPRPMTVAFPHSVHLASAAILTGGFAFALRLISPVGHVFLGLQFGYFASYAVLFAFGMIAADQDWLAHLPPASIRQWRRVALISFPLLPICLLLHGRAAFFDGPVEGGWSVPAALYAFWEPLIAWGLCLALLDVFLRHFASPSPIWRKLGRRAFAIYLLHAPVLVAVSLVWREVALPPMLKCLVTAALSGLVCYGAAGLLLRAPVVRKVL